MSNLSLIIQDSIATLTFDREGSRTNIFDRTTLEELDAILDEVESSSILRGLLIRSAKPTIFIAGADLKALAEAKGETLKELIESGQRIFNRLADLNIPTVAAIHGACVGGGCELALACDWRVASEHSSTRIGLPETQLGILPAWGGSTRLPALLGLPSALPLILSGKLLKSAAAKRKGLVDAVVPVEHLESHALTFLKRGKRRRVRRPILHSRVVTSRIRNRASEELLAKTNGLYPGPIAALQVAVNSVRLSRADSLDAERDAILRLADHPETKQLIRLFFLQERAKKHRLVETDPRETHRTAVIGAGLMGSGIAYWLSSRGIPVTLQDISDDALAKGHHAIASLYDKARRRHVVTATEANRGLDRIHLASGSVPLRNCDLVIEAAVEELAIKKKIFADLAARTRPDTILATNTSALPIADLADGLPHPERLLGLHFFNPVHRMQLVEVVRTASTSEETLATGIAFVRRIGKLPVVVRDSPGFLVNRILMPYLVEAARIFEEGGDPEAIDQAMLDFGMPMGPLRLLDEVGLDVARHVAQTLAAAFPDRMKVPTIVSKLLELGHSGRKSGKGFYNYGKDHSSPNRKALRLRSGKSSASPGLSEHLAELMTIEARLCLDEKVAASADDIDLAMVLGTGYAPFRGGPLAWEHRIPHSSPDTP